MLSSYTLAITGLLTPVTSVVATDISIRTAHFPDAVLTSDTQPAQEC